MMALTLTACTAHNGGTAESTNEIVSRRPVLIQPGSHFILLTVTEDDWAIYQDGQTVYATELRPGGPRQKIADVPGTNVAFATQNGRVAFIWTNPQRNLPGFGVSPLMVWTAEGGPQLISAQSSIGLVAVEASPDGRQILFTTNATDDNSRGDIAWARTNEAQSPTILLHDIPMGFPQTAPCRPVAAFGGRDRLRDDDASVDSGRGGEGDFFPIAQYCPGSDTTATLSRWDERGDKIDLIKNITTPMAFNFETDHAGDRFIEHLADGTTAVVGADGRVSIIDEATLVGFGFVGRAGTIGLATATTTSQLQLLRPRQAPADVDPIATLFIGVSNRRGVGRSVPQSPNGERVLFGRKLDSRGLSDANLLDIATGEVVSLTSSTSATQATSIFTADSSRALWFTVSGPTSLTGTLFSSSLSETHAIGPTNGVFDVLQLRGSIVAFVTNPTFDPTTTRSALTSTGDLSVVDAADSNATPRLVARQANLQFLGIHGGRGVVFPSEVEASGPGLYIAGTQP